ncbi:gypsy type transposase, partial [Tanacetum coccineum]
KHLILFVRNFHIPEEVHHALPNQGDTMYERPAEKIRHFRINISQLSVIGAAKVSHFEILCRVYGITPTVGLFRCFYVNSKKNGWMSFTKRSDKSPFPEEFLCLVGLSRHYTLDEETYPRFLDKDGEDMDIFAFIHTPDPTKVKIVMRERREDEPQLLDTTVGRTVPLLPVAPDRAEGELEASVDKLFDEGSSRNQAEQGDFAGGGGGQGVNIQPVIEVADAAAEDVNAEVRGEPISTLPFGTSSVSATPEHESEDHTESVTGLNLRTISAPQRFVISLDSSHHSGANVVGAEVVSFARPSVPVITTATTITSTTDPAMVVKEKIVKPSLFSTDSTSAGGTDPVMGGFTDLTGNDFLVGGIRTATDPESNLQKIYVHSGT